LDKHALIPNLAWFDWSSIKLIWIYSLRF
jgi:hypothetical protein